MSEIKVTAASIARLAYGYELMFQTLCHIAGTSGGSPHWFTHKGQEVTARVDPLWKLSEESNPHKPGDCLSQHVPFAEWAASVEKRADALEHWRQEVGKLHSQIAAKDEELAKLREENERLREALTRSTVERVRGLLEWLDENEDNASLLVASLTKKQIEEARAALTKEPTP